MNKKINEIMVSGIIAGVYILLTVFNPFSYEAIQFRISEILMLLIFYNKKYLTPIAIGCFISNLLGPLGLIDAISGTCATLIAGVCIYNSKKLWLCIIYPTITNAIIIGFILYYFLELPFISSMLLVGLGELVVLIIGLIIFSSLNTNNILKDKLINYFGKEPLEKDEEFL